MKQYLLDKIYKNKFDLFKIVTIVILFKKLFKKNFDVKIDIYI